jgi:hypothetical protein
MSLVTSSSLFGSLDFNKIQHDKDFKEDSVREVIIAPILHQLGYSQNNIVRSKSLVLCFPKPLRLYSYLQVRKQQKVLKRCR